MISWADVCESPHLKDLPYKIETNRHGKILMCPTYPWHGSIRFEIGSLLSKLLPHGRVLTECAIDTTDGTRVADVAWISKERFAPHKKAYSLPVAPEVCVEILSNSNTKEEMLGKMQLYFAAGAREVWLCDESGAMEFYCSEQVTAVPDSPFCPDFPKRIELD